MKKLVLKCSIEDEKTKRKALKMVASVEGVDSVAVDMKEKTMTIIGDVDPVSVANKLRKFGYTELLSVGPAKEVKLGPAKEEKKEGETSQSDAKNTAKAPEIVYSYRPFEYTRESDETSKDSCVIS